MQERCQVLDATLLERGIGLVYASLVQEKQFPPISQQPANLLPTQQDRYEHSKAKRMTE
jgi:hypothetical protein